MVQTSEFDIDKRHFPYFVSNNELSIGTKTGILIQSKMQEETIDTSNLALEVNGANADSWTQYGQNMVESPISMSGSPIRKWTIEVTEGELDKEKVEDVLILIHYYIITISKCRL